MTYSSDIIVGFPGETPEDFEETLRLIERVEYMQLFTFIYSKRTGTRAAEMPDNTPHEEKAARIARIVEAQDAIVEKLTGRLAGTTARVLVEGPGRLPGVTTGRLDNNMVVEFAQSAPAGQFAEVTITGAKGAVLKGELRAQ